MAVLGGADLIAFTGTLAEHGLSAPKAAQGANPAGRLSDGDARAVFYFYRRHVIELVARVPRLLFISLRWRGWQAMVHGLCQLWGLARSGRRVRIGRPDGNAL